MIIRLTRISKELTESGEEKLKKYEESQMNTFYNVENNEEGTKDYMGRDAKFFEDLGIDPPEDLVNKKPSFYKTLDFKESDYEERETAFLCNINKVIYFDEHSDNNSRSIIVLDNKASSVVGIMFITVKEDINTIEKLINNSKN